MATFCYEDAQHRKDEKESQNFEEYFKHPRLLEVRHCPKNYFWDCEESGMKRGLSYKYENGNISLLQGTSKNKARWNFETYVFKVDWNDLEKYNSKDYRITYFKMPNITKPIPEREFSEHYKIASLKWPENNEGEFYAEELYDTLKIKELI